VQASGELLFFDRSAGMRMEGFSIFPVSNDGERKCGSLARNVACTSKSKITCEI
jgi:hypothetical protein